ncbi:copper transport protein ctr1 [Blyttiomyces sp. JEL0837]|nr:copper transport protein ctr1 [Blyttiomyces sp. JEL0837]
MASTVIFSAIGTCVSTFLQRETVYNAYITEQSNKVAYESIKSRIVSLEKVLQPLIGCIPVGHRQYPALQEVLNRFHACIQSAVILIEREQSAIYLARLFKANTFQTALNLVHHELTGCATEVNIIFSTMSALNSEINNVSSSAQSRIQEIKDLSSGWETALRDQMTAMEKLNKKMNLVIHNMQKPNKSSSTIQDNDMKDLEEKMHTTMIKSLTPLERRIFEFEKRVALQDLPLIDRSSIELSDRIDSLPTSQTTSTSTHHIIYKCLYDRHIPALPKTPAIFKLINTTKSKGVIIVPQIRTRNDEIFALQRLSEHPYFPDLYGKVISDPPGFLMEFVNYDGEPVSLQRYLKENVVEWSTRIRFARQLTSAVRYMQEDQHIIHGMIKSMDILVSYKSIHDGISGIGGVGLGARQEGRLEYIKIIDFDRASFADDPDKPSSAGSQHHQQHQQQQPTSKATKPFRTLPGTEEYPYIAPELLQDLNDVTNMTTSATTSLQTDIYSLGTVLWELTYCAEPYSHIPPPQLKSYLLSGSRDELPSDIKWGGPPELTTLISQCWNSDPQKRPTAFEIDQITWDIYRPNLSTSASPPKQSEPGCPKTISEWRKAYLRARSGVSCEDILSLRTLSTVLLRGDYLPCDEGSGEKRVMEAIRFLELGAGKYESGGAAYDLSQLYLRLWKKSGDKKDQESYGKWLKEGERLGHPQATMDRAKIKLKDNRIPAAQYEKIEADMKGVHENRHAYIARRNEVRKEYLEQFSRQVVR